MAPASPRLGEDPGHPACEFPLPPPPHWLSDRWKIDALRVDFDGGRESREPPLWPPRILSTFSSCAFGNVGLPTPAPNFCQQNDARLESMQKQFHAATPVSMTGIVTFPRVLSFLTGTGRSHTLEKFWTASTHNGITPVAESPGNATLLGTRNVVAVRCTRPGPFVCVCLPCKFFFR